MVVNTIQKALVLLILLLITLTGCISQPKACIKDSCYDVEIEKDDIDQAFGLMFHDSLKNDQGMLFIFDQPGYYDFWMKNMKFSLDIIWIDENEKIIHIEHSAHPCVEDEPCSTYKPQKKAVYVLEISAGDAKKHSFDIGDRVTFQGV